VRAGATWRWPGERDSTVEQLDQMLKDGDAVD
jgi:hypothetical protein